MRGQDLWAESTVMDPVERQVIYLGGGGGKVKGKFSMRFSYAEEDSQDTGGLAIVKLEVVFPSSKTLVSFKTVGSSRRNI